VYGGPLQFTYDPNIGTSNFNYRDPVTNIDSGREMTDDELVELI